MTPDEIAALPYRPCVGVVLTDGQGRVFAGQRADMDTPAWQMPQGGIDKGKPRSRPAAGIAGGNGRPEAARHGLGETAEWLPYDLPAEVLPYRGKYRGQTQKWVLVRLDAGDEVIDLAHEDVEFSDWRWMTGSELLDRIVGSSARSTRPC
jgi:putative (di)nucleoside polyphosphate hydrolase